MPGSVGSPPLTVDFQYWGAIAATPKDFVLNAGVFGLTLHATVWGTAVLNKLLPNGVTYAPVGPVFGADGYAELHLPAGQYQLTLAGITALTGEIAKIASGVRP